MTTNRVRSGGASAPPFAAATLARHRARFARELGELVSFPSVGTEPAQRPAMRGCARWLCERLRELGAVDARIVPGASRPAVFGSIAGPAGAPCVLIYGHYDVQPAGPEGAWSSPPFSPVLRLGALYGRGASDDKGQLFAHLKAVELLRRAGALPVSVKFFIDGEEEAGSPGLMRSFRQLGDALRCDVAVISDAPVLAFERPSITYSLRGTLYLALTLRTPGHDLHSGLFGGAVDNAATVLSDMLSRLHGEDGAVRVPGFYAGVPRLDRSERAYMRRTGPSEREVQVDAGGARLSGEAGYTSYERMTVRPSLEISGVSSGHTGEGIKGVIPSVASAKLDVRVVPGQNLDAIAASVTRQLVRLLEPRHRLRVAELMRIQPVELDRAHWSSRAAARAYRRGFGAPAVFLRAGGSIAAASALTEHCRVPVVLMGLALPDDGAHAPDEHYQLAMLDRAIQTSAAFLQEVAA